MSSSQPNIDDMRTSPDDTLAPTKPFDADQLLP